MCSQCVLHRQTECVFCSLRVHSSPRLKPSPPISPDSPTHSTSLCCFQYRHLEDTEDSPPNHRLTLVSQHTLRVWWRISHSPNQPKNTHVYLTSRMRRCCFCFRSFHLEMLKHEDFTMRCGTQTALTPENCFGTRWFSSILPSHAITNNTQQPSRDSERPST